MRLIDADALFKCETCYHMQNGKCNMSCDAGESYRPAMSKLEIIEAEPVRHGRWDESTVPFCNVCPECGAVVERNCVKCNGSLNRCPNCGAKMGKEETT